MGWDGKGGIGNNGKDTIIADWKETQMDFFQVCNFLPLRIWSKRAKRLISHGLKSHMVSMWKLERSVLKILFQDIDMWSYSCITTYKEYVSV